MRMTRLVVNNYRALRDVTIPLSHFGCLIGENNSGKSSFLQALSLFFSGNRLVESNYHDKSKPIRIQVTLEDLDDEDFERIAPEHRVRIRGLVRDGNLVLVRKYAEIGARGDLLSSMFLPRDARFSPVVLDELLKRGRPGPALVEKVIRTFPELADRVNATMDQDSMRHAILELADSLPGEDKVAVDMPLPTGIENSIRGLLPEPLYIPAVKDLGDDIKTAESTPLGRILAVLLGAVESQLPGANEAFRTLNSRLNRVKQEDGTWVDERLSDVKLVESTMQRLLQESFANVSVELEIPPPELRAVLSSAKIYLDDGVRGLVETKGDGLRRAVVFSIFRTYEEVKQALSRSTESGEEETNGAIHPQYLLLFEEPELFLHPKGQHALFAALRSFALQHHVIVTTHSPMFFGPSATETFVRLRKVTDTAVSTKPFTEVQPVDLSDMTSKDQFQIICYENNNAAFFADTVVLVEGDSDYMVFPHVARILDPSWDSGLGAVYFARITGKGNIGRYRSFFQHFGVRVHVISDLDLLLEGFRHLQQPDETKTARDQLLRKVDELIPDVVGGEEPTAGEARSARNSGELHSLWTRANEKYRELLANACSADDLMQAVNEFFAWQRKRDRLVVLATSTDSEVLRLKWRLLALLRRDDIYVLERGELEKYYPSDVQGRDKPSRAESFCRRVTTREQVLACCGEQEFESDGTTVKEREFTLILGGIFGPGSR